MHPFSDLGLRKTEPFAHLDQTDRAADVDQMLGAGFDLITVFLVREELGEETVPVVAVSAAGFFHSSSKSRTAHPSSIGWRRYVAVGESTRYKTEGRTSVSGSRDLWRG